MSNPEPALPRWLVLVFPSSLLVAALWGPVAAAVLCAVACVALLYSTSKQRDLWHLGVGALLCANGVLLVAYANYLVLRSDSLGAPVNGVVLLLWGTWFFRKGIKLRQAAQRSLSRLRRYRKEHGRPTSVAPPGRPVAGSRFAQFSKFTLGGVALCCMGWSCFCTAVLAVRDLLTKDDNPWWGPLAVVALVMLCVVLIGMGNSILRTGAQYFDGVISSPDDLTPGQYVLYLRSFRDDHRLMRPHRIPLVGGWVTGWISLSAGEEQRIEAAMSWAGPLVGVGEPGETVPRPGARRMYLRHDNWKEPVRTLMRGATLVVIVLGNGKGTRWEIREAMRILPPERLLLLVPMKRKAYAEFRALAAGWAPVALPAYERSRALTSRVRGLIYFKPGWQAEFVALPRPSPLEDQLVGALDRAMWPAAVRLTEHELRTGRAYG